jgi:hypothetical protein
VLLLGYRNDVEHFDPGALGALAAQMHFAGTIPVDSPPANRSPAVAAVAPPAALPPAAPAAEPSAIPPAADAKPSSP